MAMKAGYRNRPALVSGVEELDEGSVEVVGVTDVATVGCACEDFQLAVRREAPLGFAAR